MARPDLVIFDCDGVLIDSEVIACRVDAACLAEEGIAITADEIIERYVGLSLATMLNDIETRYARRLPADFPARVRTHITAAFESELRALPGVEEAVRAVSTARCVASSSGLDRLAHALTMTGLVDLFAPHIFSATQVARGKPAPDLFLFAAERMGVGPASCLVIEDSVAGVRAAVAAGMAVIGFTGGGHCRSGHGERLLSAGAHTTVDHMDRLAALLRVPERRDARPAS